MNSIIAHFGIPRSIPTHSQYMFNLSSCICSDVSLFVVAAKSFPFVAKLILMFNVPNVYPFLPLCSHLSSGSRNIIKKTLPSKMSLTYFIEKYFSNFFKRGLKVLLCIVHLCIGIFLYLTNVLIHKNFMVFEREYMLPTRVTAS